MLTARNELGRSADLTEETTCETASCPPAFLEYSWYVSLFYLFFGDVWGIVIPFVGGAIWVLIAAGCFLSVQAQVIRVYKPVAWALCTGILVIAIQLVFHEHSQKSWREAIEFVSWIAMLITAQALSLRPGFLQRFALVAFGMGLACLPYIQMRVVDGIVRTWAVGTGVGNPNSMGMWFGFCTVYFVFLGLYTEKRILRVASWIVAIGCLYMVALSVSRGPLLGIVIACIVGLHSVLKRSFVPLLTLVLLICVMNMSGVFDQWIGYYILRGAEETGRDQLFHTALERLRYSPWIGVGLGDVGIRYHVSDMELTNPHNGLLHIALGAGIVPGICFLGYLARAVIGALRMMWRGYVREAALLPPLVVFALVEIMILDYSFMSPWVVVVCGLAAGASKDYGNQRLMSAMQGSQENQFHS